MGWLLQQNNMSKIEELIDSIRWKYYHNECEFGGIDIEEIMKEYAEIYAKRCLEIAAENATCDELCRYGKYDQEEVYFEVNYKSITNIDLPPHE